MLVIDMGRSDEVSMHVAFYLCCAAAAIITATPESNHQENSKLHILLWSSVFVKGGSIGLHATVIQM